MHQYFTSSCSNFVLIPPCEWFLHPFSCSLETHDIMFLCEISNNLQFFQRIYIMVIIGHIVNTHFILNFLSFMRYRSFFYSSYNGYLLPILTPTPIALLSFYLFTFAAMDILFFYPLSIWWAHLRLFVSASSKIQSGGMWYYYLQHLSVCPQTPLSVQTCKVTKFCSRFSLIW